MKKDVVVLPDAKSSKISTGPVSSRGGRGGNNNASDRGRRGTYTRGSRGRRGGRGGSRGGYSNEDGTLLLKEPGRLIVAFKERSEVLKNPERDASVPKPRGRGGRDDRGRRQFDRHSATGRMYVFDIIFN